MEFRFKTTATAILGFVLVTSATVLVESLFDSGVFAAVVFVIGVGLLVLLHREELKLDALSGILIQKGANHPLIAFWIVVGVGGALGAALFAGAWLYAVNEYKKNPPSLAPAHSSSTISKQPIQRIPTAAEIAEELAKKLPSTPKSKPRPAAPTRLGIGPEAYKDVSDEQVGQWAIEEARKIEELASRAMSEKNENPGDVRYMMFRFNNDFNDCCTQEVKELRAEILRRLGPPGKDSDEVSAWTGLFPATKYPDIARFRPKQDINPMMVKNYAPYLRRLGYRLERRAVPRFAPEALEFSEKQISPHKPDFDYRILVTIKAERRVTAGYIIVQFERGLAGAGTDFADSQLVFGGSDLIDNKEVADLISKNPGSVYALRMALVHESLLTPATASTELLDTSNIEEMNPWPRASPPE